MGSAWARQICGEQLKKFMDLEIESKGQTKVYGPAVNHLKSFGNQILELMHLIETPA